MERKFILLNIVITVVLVFSVSAHAIFCIKCGANNPDDSAYCISCGEKLQRLEKSIYDKACYLFSQEEYDQVISILVGYCESNQEDKKSELLLAKAYLEKCGMLKEEGDQTYKFLVMKSHEIGKKIILPRDQYLSEGLYICGRSFYINDRPERAARYIKKAIKLLKSPPVEYFIALGDVQFVLAKNDDSMEAESINYLAAKKTYKRVINMEIPNNEKGKAYYKLGVIHLYLKEKGDAKQAFESALKFAETNSLISRIHKKMESL